MGEVKSAGCAGQALTPQAAAAKCSRLFAAYSARQPICAKKSAEKLYTVPMSKYIIST